MTRKELNCEQKAAHRLHQQKWKQKRVGEGWKQLQFWVPPDAVEPVRAAVSRTLRKHSK